MTLNCNQPNCKNHKTCNLKEPMTIFTTEINYWLNELRKANWRITDYEDVVIDIIQYHKYSIPVNVYGHIEYAPKQNALGVFIRRPEHVYYGWNLNRLKKAKEEITEKIRGLRLQELRWNK
jgi:hypothetical protein